MQKNDDDDQFVMNTLLNISITGLWPPLKMSLCLKALKK